MNTKNKIIIVIGYLVMIIAFINKQLIAGTVMFFVATSIYLMSRKDTRQYISIIKVILLVVIDMIKEFLLWIYCEFMATFKPEPYIHICQNYRFIHHLPMRYHKNYLKYKPKEVKDGKGNL